LAVIRREAESEGAGGLLDRRLDRPLSRKRAPTSSVPHRGLGEAPLSARRAPHAATAPTSRDSKRPYALSGPGRCCTIRPPDGSRHGRNAMFCATCGQAVPEGATICGNCGTSSAAKTADPAGPAASPDVNAVLAPPAYAGGQSAGAGARTLANRIIERAKAI